MTVVLWRLREGGNFDLLMKRWTFLKFLQSEGLRSMFRQGASRVLLIFKQNMRLL